MPIYKDKQRGTWYFSIKTKDAFGKWKTIKRRGFATKREATKAEALALTRAKEMSMGDVTINRLYDAFMAASKDKSPTTLRGYSASYRHQIAEPLGSLKARDLTPVMVESWLHDLSDSGLAKSTVAKTKKLLSAMYNYGIRMEYVFRNPVSMVRQVALEEESVMDPENFWTPAEFNTFMQHVDMWKYQVLFQLLFHTGLRMGEALALRWVDLDLNAGTMRVQHNLICVDHQKILKKPKSRNGYRIVDLQGPLVKLLEDWKADQQNIVEFNDSFHVFGDMEPLNHRTVAYYFDSHIQQAGVKRITLHGLRHSHASFLIRKGIDDTLVAERLGHTVAVLRKYYAHIYQEQRNELKMMLSENPEFWCQSGPTPEIGTPSSKYLN